MSVSPGNPAEKTGLVGLQWLCDQIFGPAHPARPLTASTARGWGWLPALSLVTTLGLLLISLAFTSARAGQPWAASLFWAGLFWMYAPVAARLASPGVSRQESLGLVVLLGLVLYLVKVLHSPLLFNIHDEFFHLRTTSDILRYGYLFHENPLLPVSALYPGMEIVTSALVTLSGLSTFPVGLVLIGVARLVLILALYHFSEMVSGSFRVAGVATLLYMANPNFLYFLSIFKYESLALPFIGLMLYALARRERSYTRDRSAFSVVLLLALGLVAITHHLSAFVLMGFLVTWTLVAYLKNGREDFSVPGRSAVLMTVINLAWLTYIANLTIGYLAPHVLGAIGEVLKMITGVEGPGRTLFSASPSASGTSLSAVLERLVGYSSVVMILFALPFGLAQVLRRYSRNSLAVTLASLALLYPVSLILRFTNRGWEIANRSTEFVFLMLGFALAVAVVEVFLRGRDAQIPALLFGACAAVVFLGGVIAGWPPLWRLPGSYLPVLSPRAVERQSLEAASWALRSLGPDNRVGSDKINMQLMGSYGLQHISTTLSGGVDVLWTLFAPEIGFEQSGSLQSGLLQYVVVDRRIFNDDQTGRYHPGTTAKEALEKFDQDVRVSRLFHSGDIAIYDVRAVTGAP